MSTDQAARAVLVDVADDRLSAKVILPPGLDLADISVMVVRARAGEKKLAWDSGAEAEAAGLIEAYRAAPEQAHERVLLTGKAPAHGEHGRFVFEAGMDPATLKVPGPPQAQVTAAAVDHYSKSSFVFVESGVRIGRVIAPTAGEDGRDVLGRALAAKAGHTFELLHDESVLIEPDGSVMSRRGGVLEHKPPLLRVNDHLVVPAFVDFSTGHIDFVGSVTVERGVRDLFRVRAAVDLRVVGLVEGATLRAGRDADLAGGMAARERGQASVGRDLKARYLNNAEVEVGRDLTVENELVNGRVVVAGAMRSPGCCVAGGRLTCGRAVDVATLGSESRVTTEVVLGALPELDGLAAQLAELVPALEQRTQKALGDLVQLQSVKGKLSHSQAERLTELEFEVAEARGKMASVTQRLEKLAELTKVRTSVELIVRAQIYAGVKIIWNGVGGKGGWTLEIKTDARGPLRFDADEAGRPRLRNLTTGSESDVATLARVVWAERASKAKAA